MRRTPFGWPVLPDVYWMKAGSLPSPSGPETGAPDGGELVGGHDVGEGRHGRLQQAHHGPGARDRDEEPHAGVLQDGGLAGGVLLEAVEADGRVDRHRDGARQQDAEEGAQEVEPGRQHEGDRVPARHAALAQASRDGGRLVAQAAVGDGLLLLRGLAAQEDVDPRRVEGRVPPERLVERSHPGADVGRDTDRLLAGGEAQGLAGSGFPEGARELGRRVEREAAVVEGAGEGALEPGQELDALEAPEPDLPLEGGVGGHRALGPGTARLPREGPHDVEHALDHRLGRGPGRPRGFGVGHERHSTGASGEAQTAASAIGLTR